MSFYQKTGWENLVLSADILFDESELLILRWNILNSSHFNSPRYGFFLCKSDNKNNFRKIEEDALVNEKWLKILVFMIWKLTAIKNISHNVVISTEIGPKDLYNLEKLSVQTSFPLF